MLDGPPLVPVTDALVVSPQVSGVVLVVHGGKTPKEAVQKARNLLRSVDAKILGALVNNVKMDASEIYYSAIYSRLATLSDRAGTVEPAVEVRRYE